MNRDCQRPFKFETTPCDVLIDRQRLNSDSLKAVEEITSGEATVAQRLHLEVLVITPLIRSIVSRGKSFENIVKSKSLLIF